MKWWMRAALLILSLQALYGCSWNARPDAAAGTWLAQREQAFVEFGEWRVHGRLAIADGENGGSAGFVLNDGNAGDMRLNLSATGGRWRLIVDSQGAELEGSRIPKRWANRPEPLVEDALGWYLPVTLMRDWIRGIPAPAGASQEFAEDGTLSAIHHADWHIEYQRFRQFQGLWLPQKVVATSGQYRVTVVVLGWRLGAEAESRKA